MVEMLPRRRLHLAKNTFLGEEAGNNLLLRHISCQWKKRGEERSEEERRGVKRREEERSRFLRSTLHFQGEKNRGLMTPLLFLFRTIWDVHDSVRVSA